MVPRGTLGFFFGVDGALSLSSLSSSDPVAFSCDVSGRMDKRDNPITTRNPISPI